VVVHEASAVGLLSLTDFRALVPAFVELLVALLFSTDSPALVLAFVELKAALLSSTDFPALAPAFVELLAALPSSADFQVSVSTLASVCYLALLPDLTALASCHRNGAMRNLWYRHDWC